MIDQAKLLQLEDEEKPAKVLRDGGQCGFRGKENRTFT